ncbi:MAG: guanylate kinase [bacterium]
MKRRAPRGRNLIIVISGPSGVGKSTVIARLISTRLKGAAEFSVSVTTRASRPGEREGRDYRFVSREEFERMKEAGDFAEWAAVHGEFYGTPRAEIERVLRSGRDLILELDVQGGASIRKLYPEAVLVFLAVGAGELRRRLEGRPSSLPEKLMKEEIETRLRVAAEEIRAAAGYTYLVVNDDLEKSVEMIHSIIRAERCRLTGGAGMKNIGEVFGFGN